MPLAEHDPQAHPEPTAWPTMAGVEYLESHDVEEAGQSAECDCEAPEPDEGVALVSNECPIHNLRPQEPDE